MAMLSTAPRIHAASTQTRPCHKQPLIQQAALQKNGKASCLSRMGQLPSVISHAQRSSESDPPGTPGPSDPDAAGPSGKDRVAGGGASPPGYEYSDPVNRLLGNFLPPARDVAAELSHIDWSAPKATGLTLQDLSERIEERLASSEWFVTGQVDPTLFSDAFAFQDDSVATKGIQSYAQGVRKLFDQATSRVELIEVTPNVERGAVMVVWRLEGRVNLPFRPRISPYVVTTTLGVDKDGLVSTQLDEFSVPGWRLLAGALLGAWAGPPPAGPIEQLRREHAVAKKSAS